ncbi:tyrosine-type recombinase/integrase [Sphingomonas sp. Tas61C01]|uniref:tyrosine-type recombinase/integrase n=1 Tax=Sphingomonas sp. Tas61C01 TaxID=3458297 RepID=UPI00403EC132
MAIRKRAWTTPAGVERTAWQVDYRDAAGARRSKQFARKKDAEAWSTQATWHVSQGTHTPDSQSITITKAAELWIARGEREALEPSTLAAYGQHVRLHIRPLCGDRKLSQLTKPIVEGYRDTLVDTLSRPMAARVMRSLSAIVGEAQRRGYVAQNVCAGVQVKRAQREKSKVVIPTKDELRALVAAAGQVAEPAALPLVLIAVFTGLRASELRGATWRSVDLKKCTLSVDQRADFEGTIGAPKSGSGYRTIPLPTAAVKALREWKLRCPASDHDLVFPSIAKKVMTHRYMTMNVLGPVQAEAGLMDVVGKGEAATSRTRFTLHDLRHAAASLWIEQRVSAKRIQGWMGHSSIQVTFDTYGHLFEQADQDAAVASAIERELFAPTSIQDATA